MLQRVIKLTPRIGGSILYNGGIGIGRLNYCTTTTTSSSSEQPSTKDKTNKKDIKVYVSMTDDPIFNLATEDWLFKQFDTTQQILFLWRNKPTVIIGRYQNPWKECHLSQMEKEGVTLVRRQSGGGAVYQDHGNSIFTFLSGTPDYDKKRNIGILIDSLSQFGIKAEASGRNDIQVVDGPHLKKVSGSAFKQSGKRSFHHGTMLMNIDTEALARYLNPNKEKLKSKGISSVIARVCNLKSLNPEINHDTWSKAIIKSFADQYGWGDQVGSIPIEFLQVDKLESIPSLNETYQSLKSWDWRYGNSPPFEHQFERRFDWGTIDINMNCEKGIIERVKIYSDSLNPLMIEIIQESLVGVKYDKEGITLALDRSSNLLKANQDTLNEISQLKQWLLESI